MVTAETILTGKVEVCPNTTWVLAVTTWTRNGNQAAVESLTHLGLVIGHETARDAVRGAHSARKSAFSVERCCALVRGGEPAVRGSVPVGAG